MRVAILGGGSWATAIAKMLLTNVEEIGWYIRNDEKIEKFKSLGRNPNYLTGVNFDVSRIKFSSKINTVVKNADILFVAIPSPYLKSQLKRLKLRLDSKIIISAVKGIVPDENMILSEYFNMYYGVPIDRIAVISGPCHAEEVALERLSYLTIACTDEEKARFVADAMTRPFVKTKISDDVIGIEYGAMLKNIYALAAGIAHGLGYGDNFQSVLMSNAIREMERYIKHIYKIKRNINHSAYLGDLLVTAYSLFSRNRTFGTMIGKGYTVKSTMAEMNMVAEGYYATKSAYNINLNQEKPSRTPILNAVYKVLYENKRAKTVFAELTNELN